MKDLIAHSILLWKGINDLKAALGIIDLKAVFLVQCFLIFS